MRNSQIGRTRQVWTSTPIAAAISKLRHCRESPHTGDIRLTHSYGSSPFLDFVGDKFAEFGRRHRHWKTAQVAVFPRCKATQLADSVEKGLAIFGEQ